MQNATSFKFAKKWICYFRKMIPRFLMRGALSAPLTLWAPISIKRSIKWVKTSQTRKFSDWIYWKYLPLNSPRIWRFQVEKQKSYSTFCYKGGTQCPLALNRVNLSRVSLLGFGHRGKFFIYTILKIRKI